MDPTSSSTRDLARRLLAASRSATDSREHEATRACGTLRISLTKFAGVAGFTSLMSRALTLARAEVPALEGVKIDADGRLEGFEQLAANAGTDAIEDEAAVAIIAKLLELLVIFIGQPLTLSLVREAWPGISLDK